MATARKPGSIDEYLSNLSGDQREALEKLRRIIRRAAPDAEECISYQMPAFRQEGMLVSFGAASDHCAFYLMSTETLVRFEDELTGFETSKGTIRFRPGRPIPASLVRRLVKARLEENAAKARKAVNGLRPQTPPKGARS